MRLASRYIHTCILLLSVILIAKGQQKIEQSDLEKIIEDRFEQQDDNTDFEDFYASLLNLYSNPVDLNKASVSELGFLYVLNPTQLTNFINYRKSFGPFISLYELQAIDGFDPQTIQDILPFVRVGFDGREEIRSESLIRRMLNEDNNTFSLRYQTILEENTNADRQIGAQDRIYGKFRTSHSNDFSFGFLFEKDPGEKIRFNEDENAYGFDFYSYHLFLENKGRFDKIAIGDFQVQFGQGLISGAGFGVGKGASTVSTVKRNNIGIVPYTSPVENNFYKGVAATYSISPTIKVTGFASSLQEDVGTVLDTLLAESELFATSSIRTSGFHRTESEIENKDIFRNNTYALNTLFLNQENTFYAGITALYSNFSLSILPGDNAYERFNFSGKENFNTGLYFNYLFENMNLFGEYARSKSGGEAYIAGIISSLTQKLDFAFSVRKYDPDFHALNGVGRTFGETRRNFNEHGVYWGLSYRPVRKVEIAAYYDKFRFPWLRFGVDAPSDGDEYLIRITYKPIKKVEMYGQYKYQRKGRSVATEGNLSVVKDEIIEQINFNINYSLNAQLKLKTLFVVGTENFNSERGIGSMLAQDVNLKLGRKWSFNTRFSLIDGEEVGVYAYERDVQYGFIRGQFFNGTRTYIIARYKASKKLDLRFKYSRSKTPEDLIIRTVSIDGIGNAFEGNTITELRMQVNYSF